VTGTFSLWQNFTINLTKVKVASLNGGFLKGAN
jgi:hypothetical protein